MFWIKNSPTIVTRWTTGTWFVISPTWLACVWRRAQSKPGCPITIDTAKQSDQSRLKRLKTSQSSPLRRLKGQRARCWSYSPRQSDMFCFVLSTFICLFVCVHIFVQNKLYWNVCYRKEERVIDFRLRSIG